MLESKLENPYTKAEYEQLLLELDDDERRLVEQATTCNCSGWRYIQQNVLNILKEHHNDK